MDPNANPYRDEPPREGPNPIGPLGEFLIAAVLAFLAVYLAVFVPAKAPRAWPPP